MRLGGVVGGGCEHVACGCKAVAASDRGSGGGGCAGGGADPHLNLHLTAGEGEALSVIGTVLGSMYRGELAGRTGCGVLDRGGRAAGPAPSVSRRSPRCRRRGRRGRSPCSVEDQYQLGMRGVAAHVADLRAAVGVLQARCAVAPEPARRRGRVKAWQDRAPAGLSDCGRTVRQDAAPGSAAGPIGGGAGIAGRGPAVGHGGRQTVAAHPKPPRRCDERAAVARPVGGSTDVFDRRRGVRARPAATKPSGSMRRAGCGSRFPLCSSTDWGRMW